MAGWRRALLAALVLALRLSSDACGAQQQRCFDAPSGLVLDGCTAAGAPCCSCADNPTDARCGGDRRRPELWCSQGLACASSGGRAAACAADPAGGVVEQSACGGDGGPCCSGTCRRRTSACVDGRCLDLATAAAEPGRGCGGSGRPCCVPGGCEPGLECDGGGCV